MFSAAYFTYDGIYSGQYGLRIATFDTSAMQETTQTVPTINTIKSANSKRFYLAGVQQKSRKIYTYRHRHLLGRNDTESYGKRKRALQNLDRVQ